ncbi:MAG: type 2 isopentenyl-diphosphate Delta-isomerase [Gammaproteobacteria bacterium]|nr:type 2 isopentenyl-diphosphate Delta-isomerase [Gammaproteobacteria bacterium]
MKTSRDPSFHQFEQRKIDHIELALDPKHQAEGSHGLERITLLHTALPELDFSEVNLATHTLGTAVPTPFFISSMTAGHAHANKINTLLALACETRGWAMGVGSQRRELSDPEEKKNSAKLRQLAPKALLFGNIGLSQLIQTKPAAIQALVDALQAQAMIVHCNPLQECFQPEGTPFFKGGYKALDTLARHLPVPVIVKETGCGFSYATLQRLNELAIAAVDVSGLGGTHWGRIEGARSPRQHLLAQAAHTFRHWGISTVDALEAALKLHPRYEVWASGGVRSGLDAAKLLAMGATLVGYAKPILDAALKGLDELLTLMQTYEYELKVALFCTGNATLKQLRESNTWHLKTK